MEAGKTVKYDAQTTSSDPLSLATKGYVDEQVSIQTVSINNVG
jgi:hypothetical protein